MTTPSPAGGSAELPAGIAEALGHEQSAYLNAFNTLMAEFFAAQRELLEGISPETLPLLEAIESLSTGGKRLRALLSYWGWRGAGGAPVTENRGTWSIVKAGMAVELFQTSALIHDDIIDRSDTRRGAPSVHKRFEAAHEQNNWRGDAFNYGLTGGILAGDLTLVWSAEVFASLGEGALYGSPARTIFDRMRSEVLAGQYLDVYSEAVSYTHLPSILEVCRFRVACEELANMPRALARTARSWGASLKPISCCRAWFSCTRRCSCARRSTMSYCRVTISTLSSRIKIRVSGIAAKTASMVGGLNRRARRVTADSGVRRVTTSSSRGSSVRAAARTGPGTWPAVRLPPWEAAVLALSLIHI